MRVYSLLLIYSLLMVSHQLVEASEQIKMSSQQIAQLGIKLGRLTVVNEMPMLQAPGKITLPPSREQIIGAPQSGFIQSIKVSIGDQAKISQLLTVINSPELLSLQRNYLRALNNMQLSKTTYQRDENLYSEGVIATRRWLETKAHYQSTVTEANETAQLLEIAGMSKADLKHLQTNRKLKSTLEVFAPMNGFILDKWVTLGQKVDKLDPLFKLASLDQLWIEISAPQEKIQLIKTGDHVIIPNTSVKARVINLGATVDPHNQTVLVRSEIITANHEVRVGQRVNTQIIRQLLKPAFQIDASAIARKGNESFIFIVSNHGFKPKSVKLLGRQQNKVVIEGQFTDQDRIAIQGTVAIKAAWMGLGVDE